MIQRILLVLLICFSFVKSSVAQTDSLLAVLDTAKNENKVKTLNELFRAQLNSDPVKAVGYAREALTLASEISDKKGLAAAYNNLGIAYRTQGALDKALEYYITSLKTYESLGNKEGIATTKNNISTIYSIKKDYSQAMKYLEESYSLFVELGDENKIIGSMNNLGNLHTEIQLYDNAMKYFTQAYELSEKKGAAFADPLSNMGNLYFRKGNYQQAVESYEKALSIEKASNNKLSVLNIIVNLGITYTKAKQPKPAEKFLNESIELCNELQAYSFLPAIYKSIAENFANQGKWKEAYEAQQKYDEHREKIYGDESTRKIAQMEVIMELQQKEKEYDILKKEAEITKLESSSRGMFIVVIILAILIVLGGFNFYYLRKKKVIKKRDPEAPLV